jgi:membrane associated rhomboid family serine protease
MVVDNVGRSSHGAVHTIRQELTSIVVFVAVVWFVFLVDRVTPLEQWGLSPRTARGLLGIVTMTFLHANVSHLISNTVPLFVLLTLLAGSRARSWETVTEIIGLGGLLLWLFGQSGVHIGASLLVFGLISFLIASGLFFERRPIPVIVALIVGFLYGITLMTGVLPRIGTRSAVSWDGHLCGAIGGVGVAYMLARPRRSATSHA